MRSTTTPTGVPPLNRRLLREHIYDDVLTRIMHGHLPPGSRIRDSTIADDLRVSRTPVREALVRLSQDGHLQADAGRGFTVRKLTEREVRDLYPIAWTLECLALRLSPPFSARHLTRLKAINTELASKNEAIEGRIASDESWHSTLLEKCDNAELLQLIATVKRRMRVYEYAYWQDASLAESVSQHSKILTALELGEVAGAEKILEANFRGTMVRLLRLLQTP